MTDTNPHTSQTLSGKRTAKEDFDQMALNIDDACELCLLSAGGRDLIQKVMHSLYKNDAKAFALRNDYMNELDEFIPIVTIEQIFEETKQKEQFIIHLNIVFYQACREKMSASEMLKFIRD